MDTPEQTMTHIFIYLKASPIKFTNKSLVTGQAIQIGRHNGLGDGRIPVEADVGPAQIVHQDEQDVRFAKGQRQKDDGEISHGHHICKKTKDGWEKVAKNTGRYIYIIYIYT
jgi:hypothetical protein